MNIKSISIELQQRQFINFCFAMIMVIVWMIPGSLFAHSIDSKEKPLPKLFQAPEFTGLANWINSDPIKSMKQLRGKVVLIDFWTYSCINCIRTLPHVQSWHKRYSSDGLVVLGIHAPEFDFEKKFNNVKKAVKQYGLTYPIALDNGFKLWRSYRNRYWPAFYLIDKQGKVRYRYFGEGRYNEMEKISFNYSKRFQLRLNF